MKTEDQLKDKFKAVAFRPRGELNIGKQGEMGQGEVRVS